MDVVALWFRAMHLHLHVGGGEFAVGFGGLRRDGDRTPPRRGGSARLSLRGTAVAFARDRRGLRSVWWNVQTSARRREGPSVKHFHCRSRTELTLPGDFECPNVAAEGVATNTTTMQYILNLQHSRLSRQRASIHTLGEGVYERTTVNTGSRICTQCILMQ